MTTSTYPTGNELLLATLEQCKTEDWDQSAWRCGTARCFIGWASYLAGGRFISSEDDKRLIKVNGVMEHRASVVRTPENTLMHVADHASAALEIDEWTCERIANQHNTIDDLDRLVTNLIDYDHVDGDPTPEGDWIDPKADGGPDPDHLHDMAVDAEVGL